MNVKKQTNKTNGGNQNKILKIFSQFIRRDKHQNLKQGMIK